MGRLLRLPGNLARFLEIFLVISLLLLVYGVLRFGTLFIFPATRRESKVAALRGKILRWGMTTLGATFIKLGQVMSSRPDLFAPETIAELRKLQDSLPAFSFQKVQKIIEADLGQPLDKLYSEFDTTPVAAASVAQVHHGRLIDGSEVAIKVLRPNIRRVVRRDGTILAFFARLLTIGPNIRRSQPVEHLAHFIEGIKSQTDLRIEAQNYVHFKENFRDRELVRFPEVYSELCSERVLTMEFMYGTKIDELEKGSHQEISLLTQQTFLKMCFEDGFVHSDLHPGNMLISDAGELIIIDVGLVKHVDGVALDTFIDFAKCLSMGSVDDFVNHFKTFHQYMEDVDWEAIAADSAEFVGKYRGRSVAELEMGGLINETLALARKHHIRPLPELTLVLVGVVTAEGISKMINPKSNTFAAMAQFLMPIVPRRGLRPATEDGEDEDEVAASEN